MDTTDWFALSSALSRAQEPQSKAGGILLRYPTYEEACQAFTDELPVTVRIVAGLNLQLMHDDVILERAQVAAFTPDRHAGTGSGYKVPVDAFLQLGEFTIDRVTNVVHREMGGFLFAGTADTKYSSEEIHHTNYLFSIDRDGAGEWEITGTWQETVQTTE